MVKEKNIVLAKKNVQLQLLNSKYDNCDNILYLLYECKSKDMLPMLIFFIQSLKKLINGK